MIIKKLKLQNIRSYENLEMEFPKGSILLAGDIGSGKTSVLLGLQFALFGFQPGQKGASILRQGCQNAYASLEFEINGRKIILERTMKRGKNQSIIQGSNKLTVDGVTEELSTLELKDRVITLLNYPKEFVKKSNLLYKFTVYTPQEEMKAIIQERPEIRLDTLRHIFGIDRYKRIKDNVQILINKIKESVKIKEILVTELNLLKEKLAIESEKKIALARRANNVSIELKNLKKEKNSLEEKIESIQKSIDEKKEIDKEILRLGVLFQGKRDLESKIKSDLLIMQKQLKEKVDFSEERLAHVSELLEKHKSILDNRNKELIRFTSRISVLNSKKEDSFIIKEKISSLENCPTCFQRVGQEHKHRIIKKTQFELDEINNELNEKIQERERIRKDIESEQELIRGYESDKSLLEQNKIKQEHQRLIEIKIKSEIYILERTQNEIKELKEKSDNLKSRILEFEKFQNIFESTKKDLSIIEEKIREKDIILAEKNKELQILRERINDLEDEITKKEKIREQIIYLRGLQDWLQAKFLFMVNLTEKNVLSKLRTEFSSIFSEWFSMLISDSLFVRLDEDFTPLISNQDYEIEYEFLSGGERTAVALAYRLSLNQILNSILSKIKTKNLVILDEPTDGFSSEQIDKMRDIFDQLKAEQIILVSHEQKIEGFVDHVIKIKKERVSMAE